MYKGTLPPLFVLDSMIESWLREDVGRGDRTTQGLLLGDKQGKAKWVMKEKGVIAGLAIAARVFQC